jgi:hypothetical protein
VLDLEIFTFVAENFLITLGFNLTDSRFFRFLLFEGFFVAMDEDSFFFFNFRRTLSDLILDFLGDFGLFRDPDFVVLCAWTFLGEIKKNVHKRLL